MGALSRPRGPEAATLGAGVVQGKPFSGQPLMPPCLSCLIVLPALRDVEGSVVEGSRAKSRRARSKGVTRSGRRSHGLLWRSRQTMKTRTPDSSLRGALRARSGQTSTITRASTSHFRSSSSCRSVSSRHPETMKTRPPVHQGARNLSAFRVPGTFPGAHSRGSWSCAPVAHTRRR